jgi:hypothetical protein
MLQRLGQLFAQMLNALLFAVSIGLAITLWREPASAPFVLRGEPATAAGGLKREPTGLSGASKGKPIATTPTDPPAEINCRIGLASCRRWIALQERKGRLLVHRAQR